MPVRVHYVLKFGDVSRSGIIDAAHLTALQKSVFNDNHHLLTDIDPTNLFVYALKSKEERLQFLPANLEDLSAVAIDDKWPPPLDEDFRLHVAIIALKPEVVASSSVVASFPGSSRYTPYYLTDGTVTAALAVGGGADYEQVCDAITAAFAGVYDDPSNKHTAPVGVRVPATIAVGDNYVTPDLLFYAPLNASDAPYRVVFIVDDATAPTSDDHISERLTQLELNAAMNASGGHATTTTSAAWYSSLEITRGDDAYFPFIGGEARPREQYKTLTSTLNSSEPEATIQSWAEQVLVGDLQGTKIDGQVRWRHVTLKDKHKTPTIGSRKPDLVAYLSGMDGESAVATLGDLKLRTPEGKFSVKDKGQVLDFATVLLARIQKFRSFVYAFLSDSRRIVFFKVTRDVTLHRDLPLNFKYHESHEYLLDDGDGFGYLDGLLSMNSTDLGFEFPKFEGVTVCQCLGEGLTSRVYRVKIAAKSRETFILKHYKDTTEAMLGREAEICALTDLKSIENIPKLQDTKEEYIVLKEYGTPLSDFKATTLCHNVFPDFVNTLQLAHKEGFVHRDISPHNLFVEINGDTQCGKVNDWGSATKSKEAIAESGTRHTASDDVLSARIEPGHTHLPSAADDLCSLVRCYHLTNRRHLVPTLLVLSKPTEILDFWLGIDKEPTIAAFMRLAKDLDYANLSRLMNHSMRVA